ncbi:thioredoxin family protein [Staphylococcus pasteuri]|uniref:thioredoxin family protein n=1 Tax=Staphylococcus pasteuri TaxID=45972 RepID=UPI0012B9FF0D|nr:thioredoxin family protein [Staphylococcus pasteuri]MCD9065923.1 thioredoxin family protein [Staphylococcus pasteuri]MCE3021064.1 thioredoxin family protein [Staphylococcus pasteuri]WAE41231.1 thioredoxin family protein [Staphylococcus pasteuri]
MNKAIEVDDVTENFGEERHLIFGYTPTCGTCKVSERMLDIANEILNLPVKKIDLNFHPKFSEDHQIMSVPVLMLMNKDKESKRIYAFRSVPYLLENLK